MFDAVYLIQIGSSPRLEQALAPLHLPELDDLTHAAGRRLLFAVVADEYGAPIGFMSLLRTLRQNRTLLAGCIAGVVIDGAGELYTKSMAQALILEANLCGCAFPGKPLVEATGSLYNQHILARRMGSAWLDTYFRRVVDLTQSVRSYTPPIRRHPKLLMLHASDHLLSNTVWIGREILRQLPDCFETEEISLQNGTIHDCRGCSYEACSHFAQNGTCFYGGSLSQQVLPAIQSCDAMLFLCPNYNDAVSANLMALFNRLTNLLTHQTLQDKFLFGVVVSGYSGSDLVARQLLGAMCLNKTAALPPRFCLMQTAHDPGSARQAEGIDARIRTFTQGIAQIAGPPSAGQAAR